MAQPYVTIRWNDEDGVIPKNCKEKLLEVHKYNRILVLDLLRDAIHETTKLYKEILDMDDPDMKTTEE